MKKLIVIFFIISSINSISQTFKMYNGDTINVIDNNNLKQGLWIYFNDTYTNKIAQKGNYINNKKEGPWQTYYPNGNLKSEITYKNNKQFGQVKIYYENGIIKEEGYWETNRWVGEYKLYYNNGKLKYHWFYDKTGKRTGTQEYYHPNGKIQISGNWVEGKETGKITEYYENGQIAKVSDYSIGKLNGKVVEYYTDGQLKSKSLYKNGMIDINENYAYEYKTETIKKNKQDTTNKVIKRFTGSGYYKFLNSKGQVDREGTFKNGILVDGKRYYYNESGEITKTSIIKDAKIIKTVEGNPK